MQLSSLSETSMFESAPLSPSDCKENIPIRNGKYHIKVAIELGNCQVEKHNVTQTKISFDEIMLTLIPSNTSLSEQCEFASLALDSWEWSNKISETD